MKRMTVMVLIGVGAVGWVVLSNAAEQGMEGAAAEIHQISAIQDSPQTISDEAMSSALEFEPAAFLSLEPVLPATTMCWCNCQPYGCCAELQEVETTGTCSALVGQECYASGGPGYYAACH